MTTTIFEALRSDHDTQRTLVDLLTSTEGDSDGRRELFDRLKAELDRRVRDLKAGRHIDQYIGLPEPEDHTDDYDRVIMMAHMSVDDTITLSEDEFAMYVMDQWRWKQDFAETTLRYLR